MVDSVAVFGPLGRVLDDNGNPVTNAKINFYVTTVGGTDLPVYSDSGLSTSLGSIVYTDAGGYPVSEEGGSTKVTVYTGTGAYALKATSSDGTITYISKSNIKGALDTSTYGLTSTSWESPVEQTSSNKTLVAGDQDKLIECDCSGGEIAVTLPSAVDVGDGARFGVKHGGTANQVVVDAVSSQNINAWGLATTSYPLKYQGEITWLVSNGVDWRVDCHTPPIISSDCPTIIIADRLSTPPVSPTGGARYILTSSPTDDWSGYLEHDVAEWDGRNWRRYRFPTYWANTGVRAYVQDENRFYALIAGAWTGEASLEATQSDLEAATSTAKAVTPGTQHYHPAHPKVLCKFDFAASSSNEFNVSSITDAAAGRANVNYAISLSEAGAILVGTGQTSSIIRIPYHTSASTTEHECRFVNENNIYGDADEGGHTAVYGDI